MADGRPLPLSSEAVFEQYRGRIQRHLRSLVRSRADAEELTQETFLRAHRQLENLKEPAALGVWLYRIATHVGYDFLRRSSRRPITVGVVRSDGEEACEPEAVSEAPRLDQLLGQAEMSACVQEFLDNLPDTYRTAILLHDLHGLTDTETAELLGCSRESAKIRLHRARTRLRVAFHAGCDLSRDERDVLVCGRKRAGD